MSTIYAQWADVGFAEIFSKLSHWFYQPLQQRVRHGLVSQSSLVLALPCVKMAF